MKKRDVSEFTPCHEAAIALAKKLAAEIDSGEVDVSTFKDFDPLDGMDTAEMAVLGLLIILEDEDERGSIPQRLYDEWGYIRQASIRYGFSVANVEEMFEAVKHLTPDEFWGAVEDGTLHRLTAKPAAACAV
ncbi:MAG: hypothetical protein FWC23_02810 [Chitinispirillia bacterium]|nr:hypothetical protein [Chitinispirillia bacterium]MCL2268106.1 hypothetical protein [Chitinispirillia bacterium]